MRLLLRKPLQKAAPAMHSPQTVSIIEPNRLHSDLRAHLTSSLAADNQRHVLVAEGQCADHRPSRLLLAGSKMGSSQDPRQATLDPAAASRFNEGSQDAVPSTQPRR